MTVHLIKLSVGVDDVDHLSALQAERLRRNGEVVHLTRQQPKRQAELLDGGSMYWVIRGVVRARQRLLDLRSVPDDEGRKKCALVLDPTLVRTEALPFRAFQGWRYFDPARVPADAANGDDAASLPEDLASELREMGFL